MITHNMEKVFGLMHKLNNVDYEENMMIDFTLEFGEKKGSLYNCYVWVDGEIYKNIGTDKIEGVIAFLENFLINEMEGVV